MKSRVLFPALFVALVLALGLPGRAAAQPSAEVGASLAGLTIGIGDGVGTTLSVPAAGSGVFGPGVYATFFLAPKTAIEPQVGLLVGTSNGFTDHALTLGAQFDYFFDGTRVDSVYAFAGGGFSDVSGGGSSPKSISGGLGYRMPVGDRLAFRLDARLIHFTDGGGSALAFAFSIGGVFPK